jgi:hypothetical protein
MRLLRPEKGGPIPRPEESYRVWCIWVWSRNLMRRLRPEKGGPIPRPEVSYRAWCIWVWSRNLMRRLRPEKGFCATRKKTEVSTQMRTARFKTKHVHFVRTAHVSSMIHIIITDTISLYSINRFVSVTETLRFLSPISTEIIYVYRGPLQIDFIVLNGLINNILRLLTLPFITS